MRGPVIAVAACALALAAGGAPALGADASSTAASRDWSPFFSVERAVPAAQPQHLIVTFEDPSLAAWEQAGRTPFTAAQRATWVEKALARQQERIDALAAAGVQFQVEHRYVRVLNGISIVVHGDSGQLLRGVDGVDQVTLVRTLWPMAVRDAAGEAGAAAAAGAGTAAPKGAGRVRVAVLDEAVDAGHPALGGAVVSAFDAISGDGGVPLAAPKGSDGPEQLDGHGSSVADAVLQGAGEVRDSVELRSVRVLERRPTPDGGEALLGDSDDLLAGLEHEVDPNADGNVSDAADIAVVASGTPFASFAGSPEAQAVAGASALGTLVVAAAGNDGRSGGNVGTVASVAAASEALSVAAVDARKRTPAVDVRVEGAGIDERLEGRPSLGASQRELPSGAIPIIGVNGAADAVTDYLDEELRSRVAGSVALVTANVRTRIADQARAAADAGAIGVLVAAGAGADAAAGTIDARGADIPIVAITTAQADSMRAALEDGSVLTVRLDQRDETNPAYARIAGFSSDGPRLDGTGRIDVVAPGVGMRVAGADGGWDITSGTSIAAGWAAGQVASVAAAHPEWDASTLRAVVLGAAQPLGEAQTRPSVLVQGAGVVDAAAATRGAWRAGTGRIDFGVVAPGSSARREFGLSAAVGSAAAAGAGHPKILVDSGGGDGRPGPALDGDAITLDVPGSTKPGAIGGWLVLPELGVRVPWTATVRDTGSAAVPMRAELTDDVLKPAVGPGAFAASLRVSIGGGGDEGLGLAAVQRLELRLVDGAGRDRGLLGGLDAVLPGIYDFGLTGRDAAGKPLAAGKWQLRVRYVPATAPDATWMSGPTAAFTIAK